jgi:glucose/mannose-6-phosphate isomerase
MVGDSLREMPRQLWQTWNDLKSVKISATYAKTKDIIFCGMGGSNLASEMVRANYANEIKKPFILIRNYNLPAFASKDSLIIISSYSGDTEEIVNCLNEALKLKAKIICITGGGKISQLAQKHKLPLLKLDDKLNPSKQPRYAVGSQLGAVLYALSSVKAIKVTDSDINRSVEYLEVLSGLFSPTVPGNKNLAKSLAKKFQGFVPIIVASDFLLPNAHILTNQINESAKTFCVYNAIPELNHHLLEGLQLPKEVIKRIKVLLLNSNLYSPAIKARYTATEKVLKKKQMSYVEYTLENSSQLLSSLEALSFGSWFSFYLSQLNRQDPTKIPWVNYFKDQLKKLRK